MRLLQICRKWVVLVLIVCPIAVAQMLFNPAYDQPPTPYALAQFQRAGEIECHVLYEKMRINQNIAPFPRACGAFRVVRNQTLQAWGLTTPYPNVQSIIRYNPVPLQNVYNQFGDEAVFAIMAHEVGHHFDIHFNPPTFVDTSWSIELRADAWAGCALARAGMSTDEIEHAVVTLANYPTPDNPPVQAVIQVLRAGYRDCGGDAGDIHDPDDH